MRDQITFRERMEAEEQPDRVNGNANNNKTEEQDPDDGVLQYNGYWSNDRKHATVALSLGKVNEYLKNTLHIFSLEGEYIQIRNGVIYDIEERDLYAQIINLVCEKEISFKISVGQILLDKNHLRTIAVKTLHGSLKMFSITTFDKPIFRDSASEVFFHFLNKTACITNEKISFIDRDQNKCVFESQLIKHNIRESYPGEDEPAPVFKEFILNIAGQENFASFCSIIGYLLRNYNGTDGLRAAWLTDEDFEAGKNKGRTGKSLFWKVLGKVRCPTMVSGKDFIPDSQFKFQNLTRSTQLFIIDDVKYKFDFQGLYNVCSEGLEYQKKHCPLVQISIHETPKIIITSNQAPAMEQGVSTKERLIVLPVKPFYNTYADKGGVKQYHGHVFLDDWTSEEYDRLYWFLFACTQLFLRDGLNMPDLSQIKRNRLKQIVSNKLKSDSLAEDFCEWIFDYKFSDEFVLKDLIMEYYPDPQEAHEINDQNFAAFLKVFLDLENITYYKARVRVNNQQLTKWTLKRGPQ